MRTRGGCKHFILSGVIGFPYRISYRVLCPRPSFEEHVDNRNTEWGPLRVLNEDFVAKGKGFGEHEHEEFEIWTYIVKGELTHRDNHGHTEVLQAGDVQCQLTYPWSRLWFFLYA
jgi:hypothetical protein